MLLEVFVLGELILQLEVPARFVFGPLLYACWGELLRDFGVVAFAQKLLEEWAFGDTSVE